MSKDIYQNVNNQQIAVAGQIRALTRQTCELFSASTNIALWQALKLMDDEIKEMAEMVNSIDENAIEE